MKNKILSSQMKPTSRTRCSNERFCEIALCRSSTSSRLTPSVEILLGTLLISRFRGSKATIICGLYRG